MPTAQPYTLWYADAKTAAVWLAHHTVLKDLGCTLKRLPLGRPSFPQVPRSLQQILYLDRPDLVVTFGPTDEPVVAVEVCAEAPTGHNFLQRFARVVACAGQGVPFAYIFPERKLITRGSSRKWDELNPVILRGLLRVARIHNTPVMGFLWPADKKRGAAAQGCLVCWGDETLPAPNEPEVRSLFGFINSVLGLHAQHADPATMLVSLEWEDRETVLWKRFHARGGGGKQWSPLTACETVRTKHLSRHLGRRLPRLPAHMRGRDETVVYANDSATFRGDPYAGALVAVDYLTCRSGPTPAHRSRNLCVWFRGASMAQLAKLCQGFHRTHCPLRWEEAKARANEYYTLHLRDGCRYTKQKEVRILCYFADLLAFSDGVVF
ncbi:MAG: hypothetical protein FJX75_24765 [Armatimonadetes bacterium]|nr:hypothetical protein [Armatimonadota bacterium]